MSLVHALFSASVSVSDTGTVSGSGFYQGSVASVFSKAANILIFITAAVSVIMVIVGGLRYAISAGNPSATKGAKDTILYAIIGVTVAIFGYAIVNYVLKGLGK